MTTLAPGSRPAPAPAIAGEQLESMQAAAKRARLNCLRLGNQAGPQGAHFGPALSIIEILTALYGGVMAVAPDRSRDIDRDRLILSKGHGSLGLYTVLHQYGFVSDDVLETFECEGGLLPGQPLRNLDLGIEFSSGTLGMGLSFGLGLALSARMMGSGRRIFVVLGDGESNEGSVWEAAMAATHFGAENLTAIIDVNDMQSDGPASEVLRMDHAAMWGGFGWTVAEADGHDIAQLVAALTVPSPGAPRVVLARTVKGKGVSFMEQSVDWHHGRLSDQQLEQASAEVERGELR